MSPGSLLFGGRWADRGGGHRARSRPAGVNPAPDASPDVTDAAALGARHNDFRPIVDEVTGTPESKGAPVLVLVVIALVVGYAGPVRSLGRPRTRVVCRPAPPVVAATALGLRGGLAAELPRPSPWPVGPWVTSAPTGRRWGSSECSQASIALAPDGRTPSTSRTGWTWPPYLGGAAALTWVLVLVAGRHHLAGGYSSRMPRGSPWRPASRSVTGAGPARAVLARKPPERARPSLGASPRRPSSAPVLGASAWQSALPRL